MNFAFATEVAIVAHDAGQAAHEFPAVTGKQACPSSDREGLGRARSTSRAVGT